MMPINHFLCWSFMSCVIFLLVGCGTMQNYTLATNSWQGAPESTLLRDWGQPDKVTQLANGNHLDSYHQKERETFPSTYLPSQTRISPQNTNALSRPAMRMNRGHYTYWCDTSFEVNKNGRIVNTYFRGNNCFATRKNAQLWAYAR